MKFLSLTALLFLFSTNLALALNENYLPFDAETTADIELNEGGRILPAGTHFVLIRLEGVDQAVADISRLGVFRLPIVQTNIVEKTAEQVTSGSPPMPRILMFIGNKLTGGDPTWKTSMPMTVTQNFKCWIMFYGRAGESETDMAFVTAQNFYAALSPETQQQTALVFCEVDGSAKGIDGLARKHAPAFQAIPGYLSGPYAKSFSHIETGDQLPLFVQVHQSGRIIAKHSGDEGLMEFLKECAGRR